MAQFLDPKYDLTFKRVFGEHKHLCISLINSMLPLEKPVVSIEYQSGELIPELDVLRNTIVDVRCIDSSGRQFIVEMQLFWYDSFKKRVLLNASKAYVLQLDAAEKFKTLQPVYSLNFVNDIFEKSPGMEDVYFHHYKIVNLKDSQKQIEGLEFVFLELPKFKPLNRADRKLHELWLRFLTEVNEKSEEIPKDLLKNEHIREAVGYMERAAYTKEQLTAYDKWKVDLMTARSMLDDAETIGLEKGEAIGLEKGEAIGLEKGEAIGLEKGEAIGLEKGEAIGLEKGLEKVAINCKTAGYSIDTTAMIAGLTSKQVIEIFKRYED